MIPLYPTPELLWGKNIIVYDLEIKKSIGGEIGWTDFDKMGISLGTAFDYRTGDYSVYMDDNIHELVGLLNSADLVVGFNQCGFDNKLLRGSGFSLKDDSELPLYDLLHQARQATGWAPGDRFPSGLKLDNLLEHTFGSKCMKTGAGAMAPVLYQQGKIGALTSYGLGDTDRTRFLFEKVWHDLQIMAPLYGSLRLLDPKDFVRKPPAGAIMTETVS